MLIKISFAELERKLTDLVEEVLAFDRDKTSKQYNVEKRMLVVELLRDLAIYDEEK